MFLRGRLHPKLNLYVSFIKLGWANDLLLTNKKLTKVNRELRLHPKLNLYVSFIKIGWGKSPHTRFGISLRVGKG